MTETFHFGPDTVGGMTHKGKRKDCTYPGCMWPREGDMATGVHEGVERTGEIVDLYGPLPVLRTPDGSEWPVTDLRKPDWGSYCPHGVKVVMEDPGRQGPEGHQVGLMVEPWPCDTEGCDLERFLRACDAEIEEYWEDINDLMHTQYE